LAEFLDKTASLTPLARRVLCDKATEYPNTGQYNELAQQGTYLCRRCGLALFRGNNQFHSGCGWPSFDDAIANTVLQRPDADGRRTEILCARCHGHLGHVFVGEHLTHKNLRHCVNSVSLDFVGDELVLDTEEALVAGGCFWGVEHYLKQVPGVIKVEVGYLGGHVSEPSYEQVCQGNTGHYEGVRIVFDRDRTDYSAIIKRFFEIHDPTQRDGQGPDLGQQYQSALFCYNDAQVSVAKSLIHALELKGHHVVTRVLAAQPFWPAEDYHQHYYDKTHKSPYCHRPVARFD
jgi:peptide methionine sulfoxide reductase msrA/msrB